MTAAFLNNVPKFAKSTRLSRNESRSVDAQGGYSGAGVIYDVAIVTRGEALGHDMWLDSHFLTQVFLAGSSAEKGIKARFTHPGISSDGLGRFLGRFSNFRMDGDVVRGDLHFSTAAHKTPDGNLAEYLMGLATEDPDSFGMSIVFEHDFEQEELFALAHEESPDIKNTRNLRHVRLKALRAVDAVDEPAANPAGLFHRENQLFSQAEALASYMIGLAEEKPVLTTLGIDPDRARQFMARFMDKHNIVIVIPQDNKESEMADEIKVVETNEEVQSDETLESGKTLEVDEISGEAVVPRESAAETFAVETVPEEETTPEEETLDPRLEAARFLDEFGERGAVWYAEGRTYEEARTAEVEYLRAELEDARSKLRGVNLGEETPVETVSSEATKETRPGMAGKIRLPQ